MAAVSWSVLCMFWLAGLLGCGCSVEGSRLPRRGEPPFDMQDSNGHQQLPWEEMQLPSAGNREGQLPGHSGGWDKEKLKQSRTDIIMKRILDALNMDSIPVIPENVTIPSWVSTWRANTSASPQLPRDPDTLSPAGIHNLPVPMEPVYVGGEVVDQLPAGNIKEIRIRSEAAMDASSDEAIQFRLGEPKDSSLRVTEASLMVLVCYKKRDKELKNPSQRVRIRIFQLRDDTDKEEPITTMDVVVRHTKWQGMLLPTTIAQEVLDSANRTLKLKVVCEDCNRDIRLVMVHKNGKKRHTRSSKSALQRKENNEDDRRVRKRERNRHRRDRQKRSYSKRRPYLILHTASRGRRLKKRDAGSASQVDQCCRVTEYVEFRELGWDLWIIAPPGFTQGYCMPCGSQTDSSSLQSNSNICCQPTLTSALPIVYYDTRSHSFKRADIPDLITERCGCP